jgi:hypothetical protein
MATRGGRLLSAPSGSRSGCARRRFAAASGAAASRPSGVLERPRGGADADADTLATGHEAVAQPSAA